RRSSMMRARVLSGGSGGRDDMAMHHTMISAGAWYHAAMTRLLVTALALAACDKQPASPPQRSEPVAARPAAVPGDPARSPAGRAAHGAAGDPCSKAHPEGSMVMPWIADDLPGALACARERGVPVVVDEWAPWCHTCLSMQSTVFTDASFKPEVARFVFAALDTDKEANAAAVATYPPSAWPTFYLIGHDPTTRRHP